MFDDLALQNDDGWETLLRPGHEELLRRLRELTSQPPSKVSLADARHGWNALIGSDKGLRLASRSATRGDIPGQDPKRRPGACPVRLLANVKGTFAGHVAS